MQYKINDYQSMSNNNSFLIIIFMKKNISNVFVSLCVFCEREFDLFNDNNNTEENKRDRKRTKERAKN